MRKGLTTSFKIIKFIFDLIRTALYFEVLLCKAAIISIGISGVVFMLYKLYQLYVYLHITKNFLIPTIIIIFIIVLIPLCMIAWFWYYLVLILYYLIAYLDYPLDSDNDVLLNIQKFMENLKYKLVPGKRDQLAQKLGFKDMAEFEKFDNSLSDSIGTYNKNDIEQFRKDNKN
jgi:uncharacterized membrane-anchored protein YitT (DUF2179 family)